MRSVSGARRPCVAGMFSALVALVGGCGHDVDDADADGVDIVQNLAVDCHFGGGAHATESHPGPGGMVVQTPASWLALDSGSRDELQVVVNYTDGSFADVMAVWGANAADEADAVRMLDGLVGQGDAGARHFQFRGHPAVASFLHYTESKRDCEVCSDPRAQMLNVNVAIANGPRVIRLVATAPANTDKRTLCEMQATMASASW